MINTIYQDPDSLYHHGVKGMHWGVRKDPFGLKDLRKQRNKAKTREDYIKAATEYKKARQQAKAYNKKLKNDYLDKADALESEYDRIITDTYKKFGGTTYNEVVKSNRANKKLLDTIIDKNWDIYVNKDDLAEIDYKMNKVKTL